MLVDNLLELQKSGKSKRRTLAKFVLENKKQITTLSLDELQVVTGISKSSIVRFVRLLGFSDFRDFKQAVFDLLRISSKTKEWLTWVEAAEREEICNQIIKEERDSLSMLNELSLLPCTQHLVDKLGSCKKICIIGQQASEPMAHVFAYELGKVREEVYCINSFNELSYHLLNNFGEEDLLVVFGFPRYPVNVLRAVAFFKNRGVHTISFVHSEDSMVGEISDEIIPIKLNYFGFTTGYSAVLSYINLVVLLYCQNNLKEASSFIEKFEDCVESNRVFTENKDFQRYKGSA